MRGALLVCLLLVVVSWGRPLQVFVSIGPQLECVRRIGGQHVRVESMLPAGSNPETYAAGPRKLSALGRADVYFRIGVPFEAVLMDKVIKTFPQLRVVDGTKGMSIRMMDEDEDEEMQVGDSHSGHDHHGPDPHVWLSIQNMEVFAQTVTEYLCQLRPLESRGYRVRHLQYVRELQQLDREIRLSLARYRGKEVVVFHPAFGYFLNRYGLFQHSVEMGGKEPGGKHLGRLIRRAWSEGVRNIYVQPQFNRKASEVIAREIGGMVLVLDPLPDDYSKGMLELCRQLVHGFESVEEL